MVRVLKHGFVLIIGAIAVIYLINPTAGFIEFIPDNLPLIGNLDEAGAVIILTNVLAFYGLDVNRLLRRD